MEPINDLHAQLLDLHSQLRIGIQAKFNRSVPLADELTDRWERARFLGFGEGASIYDSSLVIGDVSVGEATWIGPQTVLDGSGGLTIGHHCSISAGVQIYSHDTVAWALSGGKRGSVQQPTRIGNCCYLGPYTVVAKGVTIGDHCLIGSHSLVNRDVPAYTIMVGVPARPKGKVVVNDDGSITLQWD
ncbi:MAG: acyltransferase [Candidatus Sericytochromatia bacterium]|nr:acyltransferase [Candidatus Sericytochromatia bacterium]